MDLFFYPIARIILYLVTIGTIIAFLLSVHHERRRMLNCVLLVSALTLLWECVIVIAGYVYAQDITGHVVIPLIILALLFATGMVINGLVVIKKEGFSIAHSLSLFLGGIIVLCIAAYMGFLFYALHLLEHNHGVDGIPRIVEMIFYTGMALAAYLPMMMIGFLLYAMLYQKLPIKRKPDYIVILGCGLADDQVTPLLASRLDRGMAFDQQTGQQSIFLVSGGKGADEPISEAQAMANYLMEKGIPQERIWKEDQSTTTKENLIFSKKMMEKQNPNYFCVIATNNFHVLRAAIFAKALGINGEVIGGKTASYYHPVAVLREHAALIWAYKKLFMIYGIAVLIVNILLML
ncbi:YdcF family protein [Eubacterium barkeri]|uniref:Uncharacterized SAM-binding protein YcdF, DUF218 family n=1 Tax=Eubacterium barkeri TaxID=1528 RepID=A0A1H3AGX3_EUBBA|nr:YdcF family protein [Eubacterium barkeri]SDX28711.1 Uncharacterized SAM-binding protein YcdF, DUF218 family [Eubacterium barkeri]